MSASTERKTSERERPLMEATLRIIGRTGLDGVTHRAVAAEAGMSVGAVTHHFESRDVLVDAALRFALSREMNRLRALALSLQRQAFDVEAWVEALVSWYSRELVRAGPPCRSICLRADRHPVAAVGGAAPSFPARGQGRVVGTGPRLDGQKVIRQSPHVQRTSPKGRGRIASAMRSIVRCDPGEGGRPHDRP